MQMSSNNKAQGRKYRTNQRIEYEVVSRDDHDQHRHHRVQHAEDTQLE